MSRDVLRITKLCNLLADAWLKTPDQRFGQFLMNTEYLERASYIDEAIWIPDPWHYEDTRLEKHLKEYLKEYE